MSYILGALKRAEREHRVPEAPGLTAGRARRGARLSRLAILSGSIAVAVAGLLLILSRGRNIIVTPPKPKAAGATGIQARPPAGTIAEPESPKPHAVPAVSSVAPVLHKAGRSFAPAAPASIAGHRLPAAAAPGSTNAATNAATPPVPEGPGATGTAAQPAPAAQPAAADQKPAVAKENSPPADESGERPVTLQEAMSKMTLTILVYEESAADRKVYISGKKYVKGDLVEGRYLVEDITPEGAVLSYNGERAVLRPR